VNELLGRPEVALLVGVVLALGALAFVLLPIFAAEEPAVPRPARRRAAGSADHETAAITALREIEFDRVTGKLSDDDYAALKATYTEEALAAMRAAGAGAAQASAAAPPDIDPAEAAILRYRAPAQGCALCGPRPEPDAVYCSNCGRYLRGRCGECGAAVEEPGAQFCSACGSTLAA
jgi:hypothetical protein